MIDTLRIVQVGIKHPLWLHFTAIHKVGRIPIKLDFRAFVVDYCGRVGTSDGQFIEIAHCFATANGIVGIEIETRHTVIRTNILRNLERQGKLTIVHRSFAAIQQILMITHGQGSIGIRHIHPYLLIEKAHPKFAVKLTVKLTFRRLDFTFHGHHSHCMNINFSRIHIHPIDFQRLYSTLWNGKTQGWVTKKDMADIEADRT